jgi:hypothetical protein
MTTRTRRFVGIGAACFVVSAGLFVGGLAPTTTTRAGALPTTFTRTTTVAARTVKASATTVAAAKKVRNTTQLRQAPPAVRHYVTATARVEAVQVVTYDGTALQAARKMVPQASHIILAYTNGVGWSTVPYYGCWSITNFDEAFNSFGWSLYEGGFTTSNWCMNGHSDYTTPIGTPIWKTWWDFGYCGTSGEYLNWVQGSTGLRVGWGWQNSAKFLFNPPDLGCNDSDTVLTQLWGNANFNWNNSVNIPWT